jgi:hypothetical protein
VRVHLLRAVLAVERLAAGERLVEHAAERVDVDAVVAPAGGVALGRHVRRSPDRGAGAGQRGGGHGVGDPEVGEVDVVVTGE